MLKCSRLRWVCAPQYRSAGTSTSPRLSNSRRIPVACKPMGRSRIFGAASLASVMMRCLLSGWRSLSGGWKGGLRRRPYPSASSSSPRNRTGAYRAGRLLDGDRLGEVAGLVDVVTEREGGVVRHHLQRHGQQDRVELALVLGHGHGRGLELAQCDAGMGDDHERAAARDDLLQGREVAVGELVVGQDGHGRQALVDERQRAVLELAGLVGLRMPVGDLLELLGPLAGDGGPPPWACPSGAGSGGGGAPPAWPAAAAGGRGPGAGVRGRPSGGGSGAAGMRAPPPPAAAPIWPP